MNQKTQTIAIMAILAVGSGLAGFSFATDDSKLSESQSTSFAVKPLLSGHMKLIVTDSEGKVTSVRESDNVITAQGENCALRLLFTPGAAHTGSSGGGNCAGALNDGFRWIAVGNGTTQEAGTQLQLVSEQSGNILARKAATTITWTNATGALANAASIQLATTFSGTSGKTLTVTEAGLFNATGGTTGTDAMFARKTFPDVTVNSGDSLTVTWTINIGNTTTFN